MVVPVSTPLTTPPVVIVATDVLLLLHTPPPVASLSALVAPTHKVIVPVIASGAGVTVIVFVTVQPEPSEYVIIAVPALMPVTTPVVKSTLTVVAVLVQLPPVITSLRVIVAPTHTDDGPVIPNGDGLTEITVVVRQPVGNV